METEGRFSWASLRLGSLPFPFVSQFPVCHKYFLKFILVGDLSTHMYVHHRCVPCPQRSEDGVRLSGRGITDGCELSGGCWGFNTGPLPEQWSYLLSHLFRPQGPYCVVICTKPSDQERACPLTLLWTSPQGGQGGQYPCECSKILLSRVSFRVYGPVR